MSEDHEIDRPTRALDGSNFTFRQVAASVRHGRLIAVVAGLPVGGVRGYAFGGDRYHWGLVDAQLHQYMVHKSALIRISSESTYDQEPRREELERLVGPYRRALATIFSWPAQVPTR